MDTKIGFLRAVAAVWGLIALIPVVGTGVEADAGESAGRAPGVGELAFTAGAGGEFAFNTGVVKGVLRGGGGSTGISLVEHLETGERLDRDPGILGFYRVFTQGCRYGTAAWNWPSVAELLPDGSVRVDWAEAEDRPFRLGARYCWETPSTLGLRTSITAKAELKKFELFLASYFSERLSNPLVYARREGVDGGAFLEAGKAEGDWQMFLCGEGALGMVRDGRWSQPPNPVDWVMRPVFARPVCKRRGLSGGVTVTIMAQEGGCFAVSTPYSGEPHYSLYLSLFGRDFRAGETAEVYTRWVIGPDLSAGDVERIYQASDDLTPLLHQKGPKVPAAGHGEAIGPGS